MAIYVYRCVSCGLEFEEFSRLSDRLENKSCKNCGAVSERIMPSSFGVISKATSGETLYTPNEIDRALGKKAEEKWEGYNEKWKSRYKQTQSERRSGKEIKEVTMTKEKDGKYSPLLNLGSTDERQKRREYSQTLQEHRAERKKKGLSQFDGPGPLPL